MLLLPRRLSHLSGLRCSVAEKLTEKQRRFVEAYMGEAAGNATEAARVAGYSGNDNTLSTVGATNIRKAAIQKAIDERVDATPGIMTRRERQLWWTQVALGEISTRRVVLDADGEPREIDEPAKMSDRIKATELLGKSQADFVDRHEHTGKGGGPVQFIVETSGDGE